VKLFAEFVIGSLSCQQRNKCLTSCPTFLQQRLPVMVCCRNPERSALPGETISFGVRFSHVGCTGCHDNDTAFRNKKTTTIHLCVIADFSASWDFYSFIDHGPPNPCSAADAGSRQHNGTCDCCRWFHMDTLRYNRLENSCSGHDRAPITESSPESKSINSDTWEFP
jgi:hypothetical protein